MTYSITTTGSRTRKFNVCGSGGSASWKRLYLLGSLFLLSARMLMMIVDAKDSPIDIQNHFQKLYIKQTESENGTKSNPIGLFSNDVPKEIISALDTRQLQWENLDQVAQLGLLWAYGYVFQGGYDKEQSLAKRNLIPAYTLCQGKEGIPLNDVNRMMMMMESKNNKKKNETFTSDNYECTLNQCGVLTFNTTATSNVTHDINDKASSDCRTRVLQKNIQCAFEITKADEFVDHFGSIWSFPSNINTTSNDSTFPPTLFPQVYRHNLTGTKDLRPLSLYSIHFGDVDSIKECEKDEKDDPIIIPCGGIPTQQEEEEVNTMLYCRPSIDEKAVTTWFSMLSKDKVSSSNSSNSTMNTRSTSSSRTTLIIVIVLLLSIVVFVFGGMGCWYLLQSLHHQKIISSKQNQVVNGYGYDGGEGERQHSPSALYSPYSDEGKYPMDGHSKNNRQCHSHCCRCSSDEESSTVMLYSPIFKEKEEQEENVGGLEEFMQDPNVLVKKLPYDEIIYLRLLSKGAFGEVWLGQLETQHVAIKRLLPEKQHTFKNIQAFCSEIQLMCTLQHPNIVQVLGVTWKKNVKNICIILEYMKKGDLNLVLKKNKEKFQWHQEKIQISMDIIQGLRYLHSFCPIIIHRDLKSKNILLNTKYHAKLSDFGVSRKIYNETMTFGVGTLLWTAPEIIEGKKYSEKADIYSFGVVLSEIDTCDLPFASMKTKKGERLPGMQLVQLVRLGKLKVSFDEKCPIAIKELALACTQLDPDLRPSSMEVASILHSKILPQLIDKIDR